MYAVEATLEGLISRYPRGHLPELDPIADFGIEDASIQKAATEMREVAAKLTKLATNVSGMCNLIQFLCSSA